MEKELQDLLDNYERSLYGKEVLKRPTIYQLNLLLDYIANLEQQVKKQQEIIDKINNYCHSEIDKCKYEQSDDEWECCIEELKGVLKILEDKEETDINVGEV